MTTVATCAGWEVVDGVPALEPGEVHVWRASLDAPWLADAAASRLLSGDELARASRAARDGDRVRRVAARALLRSVVGAYLGLPPARVELVSGAFGKPHVAARGAPPLHVSLAHEGALALVAVCATSAVGVDVTTAALLGDAGSAAAGCCTPVERRRLAALPPEDRPTALARLWARKEACLKATGVGLLGGLAEIDVDAPDRPVVLRGGDGAGPSESWWPVDLDVGPDHAAAVATAGGRPAVRRLRHPSETP